MIIYMIYIYYLVYKVESNNNECFKLFREKLIKNMRQKKKKKEYRNIIQTII